MRAAAPNSNPTEPVGPGLRQPAAVPSEPVHSADLFKGQKSVVIEHNGEKYRLQTTRLGKLILTK